MNVIYFSLKNNRMDTIFCNQATFIVLPPNFSIRAAKPHIDYLSIDIDHNSPIKMIRSPS